MSPAKATQIVELVIIHFQVGKQAKGSVWQLSYVHKPNHFVVQTIAFISILVLVFLCKNEDHSDSLIWNADTWNWTAELINYFQSLFAYKCCQTWHSTFQSMLEKSRHSSSSLLQITVVY